MLFLVGKQRQFDKFQLMIKLTLPTHLGQTMTVLQ